MMPEKEIFVCKTLCNSNFKICCIYVSEAYEKTFLKDKLYPCVSKLIISKKQKSRSTTYLTGSKL